MTRTALIAGATGLVGSALLRRLASDRAWSEVRVIGRRPPPLEAGHVRFVSSDFSNLGELATDLRADDVFCCLGTTIRTAGSRDAFERVDYHYVVDLARAAEAAGAKRFLVVSAVGASASSPAFYSRVKGRMESAVMALPFEAVHVVQPSLLLGDRKEHRAGEALAQKVSPLLSLLMRGPLTKYRPVRDTEVAGALVELAKSGARGAHRHVLPLGSQATA
ncbi:MAG TPA: NAD(P)H-binding protein [Verrucomicrobiae bacterium]|nr:NAD(P)H-binding protein [Verrucomicrobiae bacterium]